MDNIKLLQEMLTDNTILSVNRCYLTTAYKITLHTLKFIYQDNKNGNLKSFCLISDELGNVNIYNKKTIISNVDFWDELTELADDIYQRCKMNGISSKDLVWDIAEEYLSIKSYTDEGTCFTWNILKTSLHDNVLKQIATDDGVKKLLNDIANGVR